CLFSEQASRLAAEDAEAEGGKGACLPRHGPSQTLAVVHGPSPGDTRLVEEVDEFHVRLHCERRSRGIVPTDGSLLLPFYASLPGVAAVNPKRRVRKATRRSPRAFRRFQYCWRCSSGVECSRYRSWLRSIPAGQPMSFWISSGRLLM